MQADLQAALTRARFHEVAAGQPYIPNSVGNVIAGGAAIDFGDGLSHTLRLWHLGSAPLIEDGSARPRPTMLVNAGGYYRIGRVKIGLDLLNAFDIRPVEISYFYAPRLHGEPAAGVDDYHQYPVEPRQARVSLRFGLQGPLAADVIRTAKRQLR